MSKFQDKAIKCAVALVAATGMVACSSSDEAAEAPVNPTYDGVSVKTQFAINVAGANKNTTRMSAEETQNNSNYLGMTNVRLFTLAGVPGTETEADKTTALTSSIALAEPDKVSLDNSSHIYTDVNIPVGTNNFLFYSTRKDLKDGLEAAKTGAIVSDLFENPGAAVTDIKDISFQGKPIRNVSSNINEIQQEFIAYLDNIVSAFNGAADDGTLAAVKTEFIKNNNNQRAGSAFAILKQVDQLYKIASGIPATDETDYSIAGKVKTAITDGVTGGKIHTTVEGGDLKYANTVSAFYSGFPIAQGLPDGSMILTCTTDGKFQYTSGESVQIGGEKKINMNNITFPLPIVYFDNTPAKASDTEMKNWPASTADWDAGFTGWDDEVKASTRSIALQNNINYGVAGLQTTVMCTKNALEDNAYRYTNETMANQSVPVPAGGFPVTGLLIGGQPQKVGWEMVNETAEDRAYVVYDNQTNGVKAATTTSDFIYTLVFDNYKTGDSQENVNVAIELENNSGQPFYAQDGIVEKNQKFYLIGQLDLTANSEAFAWPDNLNASYTGRYPVKATTDASGAAVKRIFIQDYTTEANFKISSLTNAYVTIPDLRATKLQLGLSVDLQWQSGLKFDVEIE